MNLVCSSSIPDFLARNRYFLARNGHFLARKYTEQRRAEDRTEEQRRAEHSREQQSRQNGEWKMILSDLTLTDEKRFSKLLSSNKKDLR